MGKISYAFAFVSIGLVSGCDFTGGTTAVKHRTVRSDQLAGNGTNPISNGGDDPENSGPNVPGGPTQTGANCHLSAPQIYALTQDEVPTGANPRGTGTLAVFALDSSAANGDLKISTLAQQTLSAYPQSGDLSVNGDSYGWASQITGEFFKVPITNSAHFAIGTPTGPQSTGTAVSVVQAPDNGFFVTQWNESGTQGFFTANSGLKNYPTANGPHDVHVIGDRFFITANWTDYSLQMFSKSDGHEVFKYTYADSSGPVDHPRWIRPLDSKRILTVGQTGSLSLLNLDANIPAISILGNPIRIEGAVSSGSNATYNPADSVVLSTYLSGNSDESKTSGIAYVKVQGTLSAPKLIPLGVQLRDILYLGDRTYVAGDTSTHELIFFRLGLGGTLMNVTKVALKGAPNSLSMYQKQICLEAL